MLAGLSGNYYRIVSLFQGRILIIADNPAFITGFPCTPPVLPWLALQCNFEKHQWIDKNMKFLKIQCNETHPKDAPGFLLKVCVFRHYLKKSLPSWRFQTSGGRYSRLGRGLPFKMFNQIFGISWCYSPGISSNQICSVHFCIGSLKIWIWFCSFNQSCWAWTLTFKEYGILLW